MLIVGAVALLFIFDEITLPVDTAEEGGASQFVAANAPLVIQNQGGNLEGHTPRGFSGMGTGLFVGDNLNPNFPEGDGVQAFLSFDISTLTNVEFDSVILASDAFHVQGAPFDDLGSLIVESVTYDTFSRALWNKEPNGSACILAAPAGNSVSCDVTSAVRAALESGSTVAQFRVRFEKAGDSDGMPDLALFYKQNSNTNEPGIFTLRVERSTAGSEIEEEQSVIHVPVVAHLVRESAEVSTKRTRATLEKLFENTQTIWGQANIVLDVSFEETTLNESLISAVAAGNFERLYALLPENDRRFHIFYVSDLLGPNGIAIAPQVALIADKTSVDDFRATAHEIGHLLGLTHTMESLSRLMFPGANGRVVTEGEVLSARRGAVTALGTVVSEPSPHLF